MSEFSPSTELHVRTHTLGVRHDFGLAEELCEKSAGWAAQWLTHVSNLPRGSEKNASLVEAAKYQALNSCPDVPRDSNGYPSFRADFAAQQLLVRIAPRGQALALQATLNGEGLQVIPHFDQLDFVVDTLLEARANHEFPYTLEAANLPQDERNMPPELPRGGREHANFLWATCYYMRGGIKSTSAFAGLSEVYAKEPELFDPYHAMHDDPERIKELLKSHGLAFSSSTIGPAWVENARRMVELYDGDPRNIFADTTHYDVLLSKMKNNGRGKGFVGFQEKMVSMITYYLMEADLIDYFDFPLPVDFHVLRVSAANEIITFRNLPEDGDIYSEKTLAMLRAMYHDYSVTHGISQLDVCNAVWSLSAAVCGTQPGNIMLEPGDRNNREGRSTHIVPLPIDLNSPTQIKMYERSCQLCPLEQTCRHNMPSKEYYVRGRAILSPRPRFESVDACLLADNALRKMTRKSVQKPTEAKIAQSPESEPIQAPTEETLF